jgi:hypothetical protein
MFRDFARGDNVSVFGENIENFEIVLSTLAGYTAVGVYFLRFRHT